MQTTHFLILKESHSILSPYSITLNVLLSPSPLGEEYNIHTSGKYTQKGIKKNLFLKNCPLINIYIAGIRKIMQLYYMIDKNRVCSSDVYSDEKEE